MLLILNYLLIYLFFSTILSIEERIKTPIKIEKTIKQNNNSLISFHNFTEKALQLDREASNLGPSEFPSSTELSWKIVKYESLFNVKNDELNHDGFVYIGCYFELNNVDPKVLYNKTFRFAVGKRYVTKNCLLRFPVGMYLQYRFKFNDPNTYVFFALGNSANITVATSRLISNIELHNWHFKLWKGVIFVPCRYATLVFRPYTQGEIFEFRFLDIPQRIVDKCSSLEYEYYRSTKHL